MNLVKTKVMVSKIGLLTVKPYINKDPCGYFCRKTMVNAVLSVNLVEIGYMEDVQRSKG